MCFSLAGAYASGFDYAKRYSKDGHLQSGSAITISYPSKPTNKAKLQLNVLRKNEEYGRRYFNEAIEQSALDKIALVSGANSKVYMLAFVKFKLKQGQKGREEALVAINKRCSSDNSSYECVQAKAMCDMADPQMKMKLQNFIFNEEHRNYKEAVSAMDEVLGIPVEHELRYRYYVMMGNIVKREIEAIHGLEKIIREIPYETAFASQVRKTLISLKASHKANIAIANIDNKKTSALAQKQLLAAIKSDPANPDAQYWKEILKFSKYYRTIDDADKLFNQKKYTSAIVEYNKAIKIDKNSPYAYVGLLRVYSELEDESNFEKYASLANHHAKNESVSERRRIAALVNSLRAQRYVKKGAEYESMGMYSKALESYNRAYQMDSSDPWIIYNLASCHIELKNSDDAIALFEKDEAKHKNDVEFNYAYALILDKADRTQKAIKIIKPFTTKDKSVDELLVRLNNSLTVAKARNLVNAGDIDKAKEILETVDTAEAKTLLADIEYTKGNDRRAQELLEQVIVKDKDTLYPKLKLASIYIQTNQEQKADSLLDTLYKRQNELSLDNRRALAGLFEDKKDYAKAQKIYISTIVSVYDKTKNENDYDSKKLLSNTKNINDEDRYTVAWILRNAAVNKNRTQTERPSKTKLYKDALAVINKKDNYNDDLEYTADLRTPDDEKTDWLKQSIISNGSLAYNENNVIISGAIRFIRDSGHKGYSDNKGIQSLLKISFPFANGAITLQTDRTTINAGALQGGEYNDMFANCFAKGCSDRSDHKRTATTFAVGYDNDTFHADIGTAPKISNNKIETTAIVGGAYYNFDVSKLSFRTGIHRRAKDNSVLTYYGDTDPVTRMKFGAVKKTGLYVSGSLYIDENSGIWSTFSADKLKGTNVADNSSYIAMAGYYYHLLNKPNERITISPNLMYMHYSKDLSGYTFGQGGYYSPQFYLGQGISLAYMRRFNDTSIYAEISGSISTSRTDSIDRYPIKIANNDDLFAKSQTESATSYGGGIRLAVEQRMNSHLVLGLQGIAVKAEDYSPINLSAYFRYYFDSWEGDLLMPPKAPVPYVEW